MKRVKTRVVHPREFPDRLLQTPLGLWGLLRCQYMYATKSVHVFPEAINVINDGAASCRFSGLWE